MTFKPLNGYHGCYILKEFYMKSETVTGRDWISNDRCIDVLMGKLRKKIEEDPHNPSMIKTIRGAGYKFTARVKYSW